MASHDDCPDCLPETLSVSIVPASAADVCSCGPPVMEVSVGGVAWPWDEARQAWVGPNGEEARPADLWPIAVAVAVPEVP